MEKIQLSEKATIALEYLQGQAEPLTGADIAEAVGLNPKGIHGVLNSLVKKELVEKRDAVKRTVVDNKGAEVEREYVTYAVTDDGANFELE